MNTSLLPFPASSHRAPAAPSRRPGPRPKAPSSFPAEYIGTLPGFRNLPAIDLYNLLAPVGEHPAGSTVSRRTLERHGYRLPVVERRRTGEPLAC